MSRYRHFTIDKRKSIRLSQARKEELRNCQAAEPFSLNHQPRASQEHQKQKQTPRFARPKDL